MIAHVAAEFLLLVADPRKSEWRRPIVRNITRVLLSKQ
jgi:hypothetical protein